MKVMDRYVLRSFLGIFIGSLLSVSFLFTVLSVLDSITFVMSEDGATIPGVVRFYLLQLPQTIYMSAPVAALLSAMITLGGLNQNHELMALRASGISLLRAATPILLASVIISGGAFVLGNTLVPVGNRYFLSEKQVIKGEEPDPGESVWYVSESRGENPVILNIEKVDRQTGELAGVTIFRTGPGLALLEEITAAKALYVPGRGWRLLRAETRAFHGHDVPAISSSPEMMIALPDTPEDLLRVQRAPEEMTLAQLADQIARVRRYGLPETAYRVERQARFAIPLAAVILVLAGIPLAIRPVRSGGLAWGILGAIIVGFIYFVVIAEFISLGKGGMVEPWVAAWSANIIFGIIGAAQFAKLRR
ncbi:MAG TPA: LPS export ABC transporter permease LptG [bacterium]|nr:LPS export ABC transporter permease LptG [bacterium]